MPSPNRKMSFKNKVRTQISQARLKVTSSGAYKMTAARKAALMKAVKASADARRNKQSVAKTVKARNNANSGRKSMGLRSKAKNVVSQANMKTKPARNTVKGAVKGAVKSAKGKVSLMRADKARKDSTSGRKSMGLRSKAKNVVSQANMSARSTSKAAGKAVSSVKKTTSKKVSKALGTDGKNGPQNARGGRRGSQGGKTMGQITRTGPATRAKSSSTGRAITAESKKLQARGAKPATAKRTAQQKVKLQKKKKK